MHLNLIVSLSFLGVLGPPGGRSASWSHIVHWSRVNLLDSKSRIWPRLFVRRLPPDSSSFRTPPSCSCVHLHNLLVAALRSKARQAITMATSRVADASSLAVLLLMLLSTGSLAAEHSAVIFPGVQFAARLR